MEKFFKNIPYYIIEAAIIQKIKEYPDSIGINERYLRLLETRLNAGIPAVIAIALNLLAPMYPQAYKIKRGAPVPDDELQGYLDTLALFISTWVEETTIIDNDKTDTFRMDQIPEYGTFPDNLQKAAEACIAANLGWCRQHFVVEGKQDGTRLVRHIAAGLLKQDKSDLYQKGIRTAEATYLMHNDLIATFFSQ